jgi:hypothetical protein
MNAEHGHVDATHNPNDSTSGRATGADSARKRDFARRAVAAAEGLRSQAHAHIRHHPYGALGIACVLGLGVGVVLSSRILRGALAWALTGAAVELARGFVRQNGFRVDAA